MPAAILEMKYAARYKLIYATRNIDIYMLCRGRQVRDINGYNAFGDILPRIPALLGNNFHQYPISMNINFKNIYFKNISISDLPYIISISPIPIPINFQIIGGPT